MKEVIFLFLLASVIMARQSGVDRKVISFKISSKVDVALSKNDIKLIDEYNFSIVNLEKVKALENTSLKEVHLYLEENKQSKVSMYNVFSSTEPLSSLYILTHGRNVIHLTDGNIIGCSKELLKELEKLLLE